MNFLPLLDRSARRLAQTMLAGAALSLPAAAAAQGNAAADATNVALSAAERGLAIAVEADRRDQGFGDQVANLTMILRNRHGQESEREIRIRTLEVQGDGDKSLAVFDRPRDVQGTVMLTYSHPIGNDDQWLYLPALRRVKRIASNNKSGPFMGSEFAYEDIASQEVEKYTYRLLREEDLDGQATFVVERTPAYENSGYTKQVAWIDQDEYRTQKVEFYDRRGELLKTLVYAEYEQYLGQYWRPGRMEMVNHRTGKSTTLIWRDYEFRSGLTDRDFDQSSIRRVR
jgi:outer membrane lipoprotein-sorting protein